MTHKLRLQEQSEKFDTLITENASLKERIFGQDEQIKSLKNIALQMDKQSQQLEAIQRQLKQSEQDKEWLGKQLHSKDGELREVQLSVQNL